MTSKRAYLVLAAIVLAVQVSSCQGNANLPTVELPIGRTRILVEVASSDATRERGLMFRESLADGQGMLFVFPFDQRLSFWMKNTLIPLSIAYIASDGTIMEILDMKPQSLASVSSAYSVRYALEVPQGWFARAGLKVGDRVLIPEAYRSAE